ncbi:helix-turn-helix transcriptional regulator [Clostridium sp. HBUAS56017]|uniref:helix-turn-helix domain-containing protein n=1 Tax=Clostridium sp. HBUAS56017 TaxID=2571128 RepID=UPI001178460F|nr:helix-turn-helix transcriptional regulator [Clostridium sp. HBUAS56017]
MSIGEKIKSLRKLNKLTLRELNSKTGLSISFISDIENKRRNPSIDNLKLLASALNVSVSQLLDDSNDLSLKDMQTKKESIDHKLNLLEGDMKVLFQKVSKLSEEDRQKVIKMLDIFIDENNK